MKLLRSYSDDKPIILDRALRYTVAQSYTVPEKYLRQNAIKEKVPNEDLLKKDLDFIIEKTPLKILPFNWPNEKLCVTDAQVTDFVRPVSGVIPRGIELKVNGSLEMIEPDLRYNGSILCFRALPHKVLITFEIGEDKQGFTKNDFVDVYLDRFIP